MTKFLQRGLFLAVLIIAVLPTVTVASAAPAATKCDQGEFCAWAKENYAGAILRHNLQTANPGECVALGGLVAHSLANRMTKDITVYQGEDCSTEAEFTTYPKGGTFVPSAPFVVRAIQIWE
jgi:hypothetical protein